MTTRQPPKPSRKSSSASQRHDVQVVGRLVEDQEIGVAHQRAHQVKPPPLAAGELFDRRVEHLRREQELLHHGRGRQDRAVGRAQHFAPLALDVIDGALGQVQPRAFLVVSSRSRPSRRPRSCRRRARGGR